MSDKEKRTGRESFAVNFDGLCEPRNPGGVATYGFTIKRGGKMIHQESGIAEAEPWTLEASNNVAEYSGIVRALQWLVDHGFRESPVIVRGDSKLVINQLKGAFKVKAPRIVELYKRSADLAALFPHIQFEWVDRSLNSEADLLSRVAYAKYMRESKNSR